MSEEIVNKPKTDNESIQVVVRCRPLSRKEIEENRKSIIEIDVEARQIAIYNPDAPEEKPKSFTFDGSYDEKTQQRFFYEESCFQIIEFSLEGFNSTIFAYGQTGCGKSFTMQGSMASNEMKGVIPNSFSHIFDFIKVSKDIEFLIRCSYLELYNEEIRDLLVNPKSTVKCELKEDAQKGIYVKNLTDVVVESEEDMTKVLDRGLSSRTTASTLMNSESSRSHSIFTVIIEMNTKDKDTGKEMVRVGKLNLVDLAGSERQKKTGAKDAVLKEGIKINLSLSALGNVISALSEGGKHIPYRDSKLTRLLQDSLGGNSKTMMIAAISPADYNYDETMSTLRYANRAKNIKNKPKINEDPKDTIIREFKEEIDRLRKMLSDQAAGLSTMVHQVARQHSHSTPFGDESSNSHDDQKSSSAAIRSPRGTTSNGNIYYVEDECNSVPRVESDDSYTKDKNTFEREESVLRYIIEQSKLNPVHHIETIHELGVPSGNDEKDGAQDKTDELLREKEYDIELERQMREELESRLKQLENMLVSNHPHTISGEHSTQKDSSPTSVTDKNVANVAPLSSNLPVNDGKDDAEAQKNYKERRLRAKKRREEKQKREMQQILEEKRVMEEELEELRINATAAAVTNASTNSPGMGSFVIGSNMPQNNPMNMDSNGKGGKLRRRYERKMQVLKEELDDMREDFYYQRKILLDTLIEQEKDAKLYEEICKTVLSEKDLKKIIERCRYVEEQDEWIVPFARRKTLDNFVVIPDSNYLPGTTTAIVKPSQNTTILPDIKTGNHGPSSPRVRLPSPSLKVALSNKSNNKTSKNKVPILSLPGGLVSSSSILHGIEVGNNEVTSARSDAATSADFGDGGFDSIGITVVDNKKKKDKNNSKGKNPNYPTNGNPNQLPNTIGKAVNTTVPSLSQFSQSTDTLLPSVGGNSGMYHSNDNSTIVDEAGSGSIAGPVTDWGFAAINDNNKKSTNYKNGSINGPELEYSDDEDFEGVANNVKSEENINGKDNGSGHRTGTNKKGTSHGKRKKQKGNRQQVEEATLQSYEIGTIPVIDIAKIPREHAASPRGNVGILPKI